MKKHEIVRRIVKDFCEGNAEVCARLIGVSRQYVHLMMKGRRPVAPMRALLLEKVCGGKYKAEAMNPKAAELRKVLTSPDVMN